MSDLISRQAAMGKTSTKVENKFINMTFKPNTTGKIVDFIRMVHAA